MAGGIASFGVALLHVTIVLAGPPAYRFFGAANLAPLAERGSPLPALVTLGLAVLFALWGFYALSGAGLVRRLPLLVPALVAIAAVYTLRGLLLIPDLVRLARGAPIPVWQALFSAVALAIGLLHVAGIIQHRQHRRHRQSRPAGGPP